MIELYPEYFNDVFGPISQPGSSSHMAGPCRAGYLAHSLLGETVQEIRILLDPEGSFHDGFGQMNEDLGMLNGAYGNLQDAKDFFQIRKTLKDAHISYEFVYDKLVESTHPNAMKFELTGVSGKHVSAVINSTGGGMVETVNINGFPFAGKGDSFVLFLVSDNELDEVALLEELQMVNTILFQGVVQKENQWLYWYKCEQPPVFNVQDNSGLQSFVMEPILPVVSTKTKKPQMFCSIEEWRNLAEKEKKTLFEIAVDYEVAASGWSKEQVLNYMKNTVEKYMYQRIHALYENEALLVKNPFRKIYHKEWNEATKNSHLVSGVTQRAIYYMHSAQAQLEGILDVPGPMSNGGGYLYSVLWAVKEEYDLTEEDVTRGVFIAAAIGAIAYTRTAPTGEIIGCAGECGVCAAMTSAAIVEMLHGTPKQVESAASFALQGAIGWPCDPVPGGQGTPCTSRTLYILSMPQIYAQWALMGAEAVIPFHEVLDTADKVGRNLSADLLCTGRGGLCNTKSGKNCAACFAESRRNS